MKWTLAIAVMLFCYACSGSPSPTDGDSHIDATTADGSHVDGNTDDANGRDGDSSYISPCHGSLSAITGRTLAPNGMDPIPGVLVYIVPDSQVLPGAPDTVQCQMCGNPPSALAGTQSGTDGSFSISGGMLDNGGTYTVVFESGGFRHVERHISVGMCSQLTLTAAQTTLPGANHGEDTIPRIAVAGFRTGGTRSTDVNDKFTKVLDAIGITGYETFDPDRSGSNSGTGPDMITLLSDMTMLSHYQIVVVPCGALGAFTVRPHLTPMMISNLRAWLAAGGRLYASDLAYSLIDQSAPGAVTFTSGATAPDDPADVGVGITSGTSIPGTVDDATLRSWLTGVGVLTGGATTIPVFELRDPWGAIDAIPDAELTGLHGPAGVILVSADVSWHTGSMGHHPLTVMVDVENASGASCGRVVFTSYHVQSATSTTLTPQERVLEFLFFRLSTCIAVPG